MKRITQPFRRFWPQLARNSDPSLNSPLHHCLRFPGNCVVILGESCINLLQLHTDQSHPFWPIDKRFRNILEKLAELQYIRKCCGMALITQHLQDRTVQRSINFFVLMKLSCKMSPANQVCMQVYLSSFKDISIV